MESEPSPATTPFEAVVGSTRVLFRPIRPDDRGRLQEGLRRLSPESRYRRFFRDLDRLTEEQLTYLTEVDFRDHFAWMAVLPDVAGEPGIGVARWIRIRNEPEVAEAAVTVADDWHNRGIGKALLVLAAKSAVERGVRSFRAWVLGGNTPVLGLLKELGARAGRWESGVIEMTVPLPADPAELNTSPAPLILRAVARGDIEGRVLPERPEATELS